MTTSRPPPMAGDGMLHPLPLTGLVVLIINDHVGKAQFPGVVTGKLSDVAGLLFFPLLLVALIELLQSAMRRYHGPSARTATIAVLVTGVVFTLTKTWTPAAEAYRFSWAMMQWPVWALRSLFTGEGLPGLRPVSFVMDPTDVIAVPALAFAWLVALQRARYHERAAASDP